MGTKRKPAAEAPTANQQMKRLYRSESNRKIAGVCGGIGEHLDVDPTIVRLIAVVFTFVTGIIPFIIGYLVAWWIVPTASEVKPR
jgi:phage shock protein C